MAVAALPIEQACISLPRAPSLCSCRKLHSVLGSYDGEDLQWHAVTKAMSNPTFQGPECSAELKNPPASAFFQPRKRPASAQRDAEPAGEKEEKEAAAGGKTEEEKEGGVKAAAEPAPTTNADEQPSQEDKVGAAAAGARLPRRRLRRSKSPCRQGRRASWRSSARPSGKSLLRRDLLKVWLVGWLLLHAAARVAVVLYILACSV